VRSLFATDGRDTQRGQVQGCHSSSLPLSPLLSFSAWRVSWRRWQVFFEEVERGREDLKEKLLEALTGDRTKK